MRFILFWKPLGLPAKGDNRGGSISGQTTWAVRDVPRPYFGVLRQHSGGQPLRTRWKSVPGAVVPRRTRNRRRPKQPRNNPTDSVLRGVPTQMRRQPWQLTRSKESTDFKSRAEISPPCQG